MVWRLLLAGTVPVAGVVTFSTLSGMVFFFLATRAVVFETGVLVVRLLSSGLLRRRRRGPVVSDPALGAVPVMVRPGFVSPSTGSAVHAVRSVLVVRDTGVGVVAVLDQAAEQVYCLSFRGCPCRFHRS